MVGSDLSCLQSPKRGKNVSRDVEIVCADRKNKFANKIRARRFCRNRCRRGCERLRRLSGGASNEIDGEVSGSRPSSEDRWQIGGGPHVRQLGATTGGLSTKGDHEV
jgi:hypothetical protein